MPHCLRPVKMTFRLATAAAVVVLGFLALLGWLLGEPALIRWRPGAVIMKVNTAIGLISLGLALLLSGITESLKAWGIWQVRLLAAGPVVLGLLTLFQYVSGWELGIDQLLARDVYSPAQTGYPGRMSINATLCFTLLGTAILALTTRYGRRYWLSQGLGLIAGLVALTAIVGHAYEIDQFYQIGAAGSIAPQTAIAFLFMAVAVITACPAEGFMAALVRTPAARELVWRQLAPLIVLTLVLGSATFWGERLGLFSHAVGKLLYGLLLIVGFLVLGWRNAVSLDKAEAERRRAEDALLRTNEKLSVALRARDEFLSIASHELKTPITSLKMRAQLIRREMAKGSRVIFEPEQVRKTAELYDRQTGRLAALVEDMLDVSRIQSGRMGTAPERCSLGAIVLEAVERLQPQMGEAGISPELRIEDEVEGHWDPFRLDQVVSNLLTNAIRYGEGRPVAIRLSRVGGLAVLSVRDQGIGIAAENHARIFSCFERVVSSQGAGGLGIGLYISSEIVKLHQGRMWVESELGKGATFHVELPIRMTE